MAFVHVTDPHLPTARAASWDVSYDYRWRPSFSIRAGYLERRGSDELMLDAVREGSRGELRLQSSGRSTYRSLEVGFHASHASRADLTATYSRSLAEGDLNSFANYFDTMLWPVVPPHGFGPLPTDVPHRFREIGRAHV